MTPAQSLISKASVTQAEIKAIHRLDDPVDVIVYALWVAKVKGGIVQATSTDVATILRDVFGMNVSRQKVEAVLASERQLVARKKIKGRNHYQLMQPGSDLAESFSDTVVMVDPSNALSSIRSVQDVFAGITGEAWVCDPYVDVQTLDQLRTMTSASRIHFLTVTVKDKAKFVPQWRAFVSDSGNAHDMRIAPQGMLHDRYVIHDSGMILIGTSLNGLGKKQCYIVQVTEDVRRASLDFFSSVWDKATVV
jgi:hypothetical protein